MQADSGGIGIRGGAIESGKSCQAGTTDFEDVGAECAAVVKCDGLRSAVDDEVTAGCNEVFNSELCIGGEGLQICGH
ncbi:MAG: hypothetical protein ACK48Y_21505, partial [Planctomyces sp.]